MTKSNVSGIASLVLVLVAFSSLVSMVALARIDNIVHQDLYRYNLQFSYEWAMPYWTMTTLVFAMGWFNIVVAIVFQFYMLRYGRKEAKVAPQKEELKPRTTYQPPTEEKPMEVEKEEVEEPKPEKRWPAETVKAETEEMIASPMEVELEMQREGEETQELAEEYEEEPVTVIEEKIEEAEPKEPLLSLKETELGFPEKSDEAETSVEAPEEEAQEPVKQVTSHEYAETTHSPYGAEEQKEPIAPFENVKSESKSEEAITPLESIETTLPEEAQKVEERREPEEEPVETVETMQEPEEKFEEPQEPLDVQLQEETSYAEEEIPRDTVETETLSLTPEVKQRPRKEKKDEH